MTQVLVDGTAEFLGGQNEAVPGDRVAQNQYVRGVNVTTRDGYLSPRPAFVHRDVRVVTEGGVGELSFQKIFRRGKFQAACSYRSSDGECVLAVKNGIIFRIDPNTFTAEVLPIGNQGDRMNQYKRRIPRTEAGRFVVFFDYPNLPVIVDGHTARRANPERESLPGVWLPEVPTSVMGAYVQNRLWVCNDGSQFGAGDPVGGINADAPITFEESLAPAGTYNGQFFSLGSQSTNDAITALTFLQVADTSTGIGPLIVATEKSLYSESAHLPRAQWETDAFGRCLLYNAGICGPRAFAHLNSDLFFLSADNQVRSLYMSKAEQQRWTNTAMSREITKILSEFAKSELLDLAFLGAHKNRVFVSVAPYRASALSLEGFSVTDYAHAGLAVLELDNSAVFGTTATPAWAGLWTGISPMEMVVCAGKVFFFSKDDGGVNRLYEMSEDLPCDMFEGREKSIISRVYTREYDFQARFEEKRVKSIDYSFSGIEGDFAFLAEYRPGHLTNWYRWGKFEHVAQIECEDVQDSLPVLQAHDLKQLSLGDPEQIPCDRLTGELGDSARTVGLRLTMRGRNWRLEGLRLKATFEPGIDTAPVCDTIMPEALSEALEPSDFEIYRTATSDATWPQPTSII